MLGKSTLKLDVNIYSTTVLQHNNSNNTDTTRFIVRFDSLVVFVHVN